MIGIESGGGDGAGALAGSEWMPEWVREGEEPDPRVRDEKGERVEYGERRSVPAGEKLDVAREKSDAGAGGVGLGAKDKSLDDWLAEDEGEEGSESGSEESEEESTGSEEGTEEESEEEDDSERVRLVGGRG